MLVIESRASNLSQMEPTQLLRVVTIQPVLNSFGSGGSVCSWPCMFLVYRVVREFADGVGRVCGICVMDVIQSNVPVGLVAASPCTFRLDL